MILIGFILYHISKAICQRHIILRAFHLHMLSCEVPIHNTAKCYCVSNILEQ